MSSTLDLTGEEDPVTGLGHGTGALGPSDSSDSGSDTIGGPGMDEGLADEQSREMPMTTRRGAGRDLGDTDLDSDSDRTGTGERASSGVDSGAAVDQMMSVVNDPGVESGADELDDPDLLDVADDAKTDEEIEADEGGTSVDDGAT